MTIAGTLQDSIENEPLGGIVLCGGKSRRMGLAKSELPFGDLTMIEHIIDTLAKVTDYCVIVGEVNVSLRQQLEKRHGDRILFRKDETPVSGPLEGIRSGIKALTKLTSAAFVTSCDVPLLKEGLVRFLFSKLQSFDAVIPQDDKRSYGLTAVYRTTMLPILNRMVSKQQLRVSDLSKLPNTCTPSIEELREYDAELESFININAPDDYLKLLSSKGLQCPAKIRAALKEA